MRFLKTGFATAQKSAFFLPYPHPTIVDMQYVSHVERAVASAMSRGIHEGFWHQ